MTIKIITTTKIIGIITVTITKTTSSTTTSTTT